MFGLALRTYQRKVQRLMQSTTEQHRTLWEAVLGHVTAQGTCTRTDIERRFRHDDAKDVAAVLKDLVATGLLYRSGEAGTEIYRTTSAADRTTLASEGQAEAATAFVWLTIFHNGPIDLDALSAMLPYEGPLLESALRELARDGRVEAGPNGRYSASKMLVPVGAARGWEAAVFDHFQAMANAVAAKIGSGRLRSEVADTIGGATLHFDIYRGHPIEAEVRGLLRRVRTEVNALWERVEAENEAHPIERGRLEKIAFYFGQGAPIADAEEGSDD